MDRRWIGLVGVGATAMLAACSSNAAAGGDTSTASSTTQPAMSSAAAAGPTVTFQGLRLSGGYVPQPASPDVAAAYLTIHNTTGRTQRLTKVVTNVTKSVMAMNENDNGSVGSMTDIATVAIPGHSTYRFTPDHAHLMLEHPEHLVAGERVTMTITFAPAGTTTVLLPVLPIGQAPQQVPSTYRSGSATTGSSMTSMPGMDMSGSN